MADVTVKQLADTVGAPVDRLLKQMQEAGLIIISGGLRNRRAKTGLLGFLKQSHGAAAKPAEKITLKRKSTGTLKSGQGRAGRSVTVEVRRKRTYVKRSEIESAEAPAPQEDAVSQSELEAKRIRDEEAARIQAEEDARLSSKHAKKRQSVGCRGKAACRRRTAAAGTRAFGAVEKRRRRLASEPKVVSAADIQAKEQSEQRGGKRARGLKEALVAKVAVTTGVANSFKVRATHEAQQPQRDAPLQVDQQGGDFKPTEFISREVEVGE